MSRSLLPDGLNRSACVEYLSPSFTTVSSARSSQDPAAQLTRAGLNENMVNTSLCQYCSCIRFELLRCPTVAEIRLMNDGAKPSGDEFPFKYDESLVVDERLWPLGPVSRIRSSAATCPMCKGVTGVIQNQAHLLKSWPDTDIGVISCSVAIHPAANLEPPEGVTWKGAHWEGEDYTAFTLFRMDLHLYSACSEDRYLFLEECFQTYYRESTERDKNKPWFDCSETPDARLYGGRKRPAMLERSLPAEWLQHCLQNHSSTCEGTVVGQSRYRDGSPDKARLKNVLTQYISLMQSFRLIDVARLAIVDFADVDLARLEYTALSYVWGLKPQTAKLLRSNYDEFHRARGLDGQLSRTIEDACHFTASLGFKYIWVDALCIVQDNDDDKSVQIDKMAMVYSRATLTIIAAADEDAHAGLPGISQPRGNTQEEVIINDEESSAPLALLTMIKPRKQWHSPTSETQWMTRGWTLQERALSRRTVTFTDEQVLWACCRSHWTEETMLESDLATVCWQNLQDSEFYLTSVSSWTTFSEYESGQLWPRFERLVQDYTDRALSFQGDALDAFSAILRQAQEMTHETFLWGIPSCRFELGLCWEPRHGLERRLCLTTLPVESVERRHVPFPSWSWMGWKGGVSLKIQEGHVPR